MRYVKFILLAFRFASTDILTYWVVEILISTLMKLQYMSEKKLKAPAKLTVLKK